MARDAKEILKECGAFLEGHFLLSSGRHSGAYCQMAYLQQYPEKCGEVMAPVAEQLKAMDVDVFVGPAMGGIVYAYELARQCGKRAIFTERVDNQMTLKRFAINPGERCVIAEDVVTTGVSSLETKRVIEEAGGVCLGIVCVVDRTTAAAPSPIPILASALKLQLPNYAPTNARSARKASCRWCTWAAAKCRKRRSKRLSAARRTPKTITKRNERQTMQAYLILANGTVLAGQSVGCPGTTVGEVVFATGMVGFPGDADRPELLRPDHHPDLPADRQLRLEQRGYGERAHLGAGVHRARGMYRPQQLPL